MSRLLMAVRQKVVDMCQQGTDMSVRCIVDAVLAKLDSVCSTDVNNKQAVVVITNLKVRLHTTEYCSGMKLQ